MYFDYAATSIKRKDVLENLIKDLDIYQGNPSSIHSLGRDAKVQLDKARAMMASYIGADPSDIYFMSGASEANNTVIKHFNKGSIISTNIEHKSVVETLDHVANEVIILEADESGQVSLEDLKGKLKEDTKLVVVMFVNNETGVIQPIEEIGDYLKDKDIWFHVDGVQALGHLDINIGKLNVDSMSFTGHKIGGLDGFGVLYLRENISNLVHGGNQENGQRGGTSNLLGALSMAKSLEKLDGERGLIKDLKEYFLEGLKEIPHEVNGDLDKQSDHIVNIYFPFVKSDLLLTYLDLKGVYVSAGSACNANTLEPSYVIEAMYDKERAKHSVRFSFGFTNTKDQIDTMISYIKEMYDKKR